MFKKPKTFLVGITTTTDCDLQEYLEYTNQQEFLKDYYKAKNNNISEGEILCSFYAKLCYKSLILGKNQNVSKIRDIESNLKGTFDSKHGSVFEHCNLNFITTDCSRVFTHELVRHRVGTAFSQTSGRYVAIDQLDFVLPPELEPEQGIIELILYELENRLKDLRSRLIKDGMSLEEKKKITSAIRRLAPNGQTNEIGWSCNIRSLRHMIEMRTSRHSEWEIRYVFNDVAQIIEKRFPLMLYGGSKEMVNGLNEWTNLRI